eukprot:2433014-Alexandrium_andersonii.AAC.1
MVQAPALAEVERARAGAPSALARQVAVANNAAPEAPSSQPTLVLAARILEEDLPGGLSEFLRNW